MGKLLELQEVVAKGNWVILDTETTGLKNAEIIQIAIINNMGDTLLNTFVCPVRTIPPQATTIHGITDNMVQDAPKWLLVGDLVQEHIQGCDVLVYNAAFDRHMLYSSDEHSNITRTRWKELASWYCVMEAFAEYYGEYDAYHGSYRWKTLSVAAHRAGFEGPQKHSALSDCLMVLAVVKFLAEDTIQW